MRRDEPAGVRCLAAGGAVMIVHGPLSHSTRVNSYQYFKYNKARLNDSTAHGQARATLWPAPAAPASCARGDTAVPTENGSDGGKITLQIPKEWQPMSVNASVAHG